jgi:hypothetical protein
MNSNKFIIIFFAFLLPHSTSCMEKLISVFFNNPTIRNIDQQIEEVLEDKSLSEYERNSRLVILQGDLLELYTKNPEREDYDATTAQFIEQQQKNYAQAVVDIEQKENTINELEQKVRKQWRSKKRNLAWAQLLIADYQTLKSLCPREKLYSKHLDKLRNLKLRLELEEKISKLQETKDKEGLLTACKEIIKTYTEKQDKEKAPYKEIILKLEDEKAREALEDEKARQVDFTIAQYESLQKFIDHTELDKNMLPQERITHIICTLEERVKIGMLIPSYADQVIKDKLKIELLHRDLHRINEEENRKREIKENLERLDKAKTYLANAKSLTIIGYKMQLAELFDETAQLRNEISDTENASYDYKKAREFRYEALALAQAKRTKDSEAEQKLLALLAPKV